MTAIATVRMLLAAAAVLTAGACGGEDWPRLVGQGLYNAGRYLCTQSADCDTPGGGPGSTSNRR